MTIARRDLLRTKGLDSVAQSWRSNWDLEKILFLRSHLRPRPRSDRSSFWTLSGQSSISAGTHGATCWSQCGKQPQTRLPGRPSGTWKRLCCEILLLNIFLIHAFFLRNQDSFEFFLLLVVRESKTSDARVTSRESVEQSKVESPPHLSRWCFYIWWFDDWDYISKTTIAIFQLD